MIALAAAQHLKGPHIDWAAFSPLLAFAAGGLIVLVVGLLRPRAIRHWVVPVLSIVAFAAAIGLAIWRFHHPASIISGALRIDDLALELDMLFATAGIAAVLLSWRGGGLGRGGGRGGPATATVRVRLRGVAPPRRAAH